MAGAGYKLFGAGDILTAGQVNTYLNEQSVMVFATTAARDAALTSVLAEGMTCYVKDNGSTVAEFQVYDGAAWQVVWADVLSQQLIQSGSYTWSTASATGYGTSTSFPVAFAAAPVIVGTIKEGTAGAALGYYVKTIDLSATAFRFRHYATSGYHSDADVYPVDVHWIAIGTPA